jgi:hypothetical protein
VNLFGWEKVERTNPYYKGCLTASVAAGFAAGNIVGGSASVPTGGLSFLAVPAGLAGGFAAGYVVCPYLAPGIRRKIEAAIPLSELEVRSAAESLGMYAGLRDASQAIRLLSIVRLQPRAGKTASQCADPATTAQQLLHLLG